MRNLVGKTDSMANYSLLRVDGSLVRDLEIRRGQTMEMDRNRHAYLYEGSNMWPFLKNSLTHDP